MATQVSLTDGAVASAGALAIQTNGTTQAVSISTGQVATLAQNPILTSGTANGVAYLNGSKAVTSGSALTFDGTNFATTGTASATKIIPTGGSATGNGMYLPASNTLAWSNNGSETMRLDASGNLGLGVTPSAWSTAFSQKAIQFGPVGSLMSLQAATTNNQTFLASNAVNLSGGWTYQYSDLASQYRQYAGTHAWYTAASGTAGNAITFTQAMTLDASGNLGVGTTSPSFRLEVTALKDNVKINASQAGQMLAMVQSSANPVIMRMTNNSSNFWDTQVNTDNSISWDYNDSEKARIDSSGRLLVGATSAADSTLRTQSGSSSADGRVQSWFSTSNNGSYGNLQLGSANTGTNTECSIKFVSGATALGNSPTSANGTQYDWGIGLSTYTVGGNVFGVACTANGGNNVKLNYNSTSWLSGSDERIKDITGNIENALSIISPWRTVFYTLKTDASKDVKAGLLAQDVIQTLPEVVDVPEREYNDKGELIPLSVAYTEIVPVLVKAIQEQQALIQTLTDRITALENK